MDEFTLAKHSLQLAKKDLGLEDNINLEGTEDPFERLIEFLEKRIKYMLNSDFSGLLNALYRIDIPENQVRDLLEFTEPQSLAKALTLAILEREKQKVITRQQYRQS